jgi:D-serine deaminase-like pyridoxal phosphate-dependent protein
MDNGNSETKFIASTLLEIEMLHRLLKGLNTLKHRPNVLYGIPLVPSHVCRLAKLAADIGEDSISVMIDHPDQIPYLRHFFEVTNFPACVFVKVDTGYHRAGLPPVSLNKNGLLEKLADAEAEGWVRLLGLYSHSSLSYNAKTPAEAMTHLIGEIRGCKVALNRWLPLLPQDRELVISVGATPQVSCSHNLVEETMSSPEAEELKALLRNPCPENADAKVKIELHAGNYPILDMQQISTNARENAGKFEDEIAMTIIAEVCSVYNDNEREKPEALIAAGTLALGREPCANYPGWGVLSSWRRGEDAGAPRMIVDRISQEHGIVAWEAGVQRRIPLGVGDVVRVFPNHACVAAAFFGWYFVVDSESDRDGSQVVDVWVRGRGSDVSDPLFMTRFQ